MSSTSAGDMTNRVDSMSGDQWVNVAVFNNERDSDIILQHKDGKIFAHRVVLRIWSLFFDRALSSKFSVATSGVFHLDDEDDLDAVYSMLRHMYGMRYGSHPDNTLFGLHDVSALETHFKVYMIADKYDCPGARMVAMFCFEDTRHSIAGLESVEELVPYIAKLCGPNALEFADPSLQASMLQYCIYGYREYIKNAQFAAALADDSLFSETNCRELLKGLGEQLHNESNPSPQGLSLGLGLEDSSDLPSVA